jgi:hypothetical protein
MLHYACRVASRLPRRRAFALLCRDATRPTNPGFHDRRRPGVLQMALMPFGLSVPSSWMRRIVHKDQVGGCPPRVSRV